MKKYAILCGFCTALFTLHAAAHNIQLNASLAPVTVADEGEPVSYTHLTLPTILLV